MKGHGHAAIRQIEGFLDAIAMVHVDIEVKHTGVDIEQLYDRQHDVVHIAEPARLGFLSVVQATSPVDGDVGLPVQQQTGSIDRRTR